MRNCDNEESCAWERLGIACSSAAASDHGEEEAELLARSGCSETIRNILASISTSGLRSAALNTAALRIRSGLGFVSNLTANSLRDASRLQILSAMLERINTSPDESQMIAISIEYTLH